MSFEVGQSVTAQTIVTNLAGTPVNTPTVVVTVTDPAGIITTPAVTNTAAGGIYTAVVPAALAGTYLLRWVSSGTVVGAHEDQFNVRVAGARIISLADAKAQLNITGTDQDDELGDVIDSLTADVEYVARSVMVPRTVTETIEIASDRFRLSYLPVLSLTSIVTLQQYWIAPLLTDLVPDLDTGIVYRTSGIRIYGRFTVTYRAGRTIIPAAANQAARLILQHRWRSQHNPSAGRPVMAGEPTVPVGGGYSIPYAAAELLQQLQPTGPAVV